MAAIVLKPMKVVYASSNMKVTFSELPDSVADSPVVVEGLQNLWPECPVNVCPPTNLLLSESDKLASLHTCDRQTVGLPPLPSVKACFPSASCQADLSEVIVALSPPNLVKYWVSVERSILPSRFLFIKRVAVVTVELPFPALTPVQPSNAFVLDCSSLFAATWGLSI